MKKVKIDADYLVFPPDAIPFFGENSYAIFSMINQILCVTPWPNKLDTTIELESLSDGEKMVRYDLLKGFISQSLNRFVDPGEYVLWADEYGIKIDLSEPAKEILS